VDRSDWNARYAGCELVWGAEPNRFLAAELGGVEARGSALDLACGEGRNAIWLASRGWRVTAVDFSQVAIERARRLAARQGVRVAWLCDDVTSFEPPQGAFELVVIAYLQLPMAERRGVLAHAASALSPGGDLLMIGHARRNLTEGVGGPRDPAVLWDLDELAAELEALGLVVERCQELRRPVATSDGVGQAIDALARAHPKLAPASMPPSATNSDPVQ
jgi:SAM-dependent methyltransferase